MAVGVALSTSGMTRKKEMMMEQEQFTPEYLAYLRAEVQHGIDRLDRGEYSDFDAKKIIAEERSRLLQERQRIVEQ